MDKILENATQYGFGIAGMSLLLGLIYIFGILINNAFFTTTKADEIAYNRLEKIMRAGNENAKMIASATASTTGGLIVENMNKKFDEIKPTLEKFLEELRNLLQSGQEEDRKANLEIVSIVANGQKMILESQNQNFEKINKSLEKIEANFKQNGVNS